MVELPAELGILVTQVKELSSGGFHNVAFVVEMFDPCLCYLMPTQLFPRRIKTSNKEQQKIFKWEVLKRF